MTHFKTKESPSRVSMLSWTHKFQTFGSTENRNKKRNGFGTHSGRPKTVTTLENARRLKESIEQDPEKSLRRRSRELGLKKDTVHRLIKTDLHLRAYSLQVKQKINDADIAKRVEMCQWFNNKLQDDPEFINGLWFSDEAHFYLSGHVSSKHAFFWGDSKPDYALQRPLHALKCTAWAAMSSHGVIGPIWFVDDDNETTTINAQRYIRVLQQFLVALKRRRLPLMRQWFMQDGATPHTANVTLEWLGNVFADRLISRRTEIEWATHSPDLNPCDFFLWGYLKNVSYRGKPETIDELKTAVHDSMNAITVETCRATIANFKKRVQRCLECKGKHFEHLTL